MLEPVCFDCLLSLTAANSHEMGIQTEACEKVVSQASLVQILSAERPFEVKYNIFECTILKLTIAVFV